MNLPRTERFKRKNVILLGIIPNMDKEPPTNTFIRPLITELIEAWEYGFDIESKETGVIENFKLALLCVGCDIPACRKIGGFLWHSAKHGCSKCNKEFPGAVGERNYGGFDLSKWEERTTSQHRTQMREILLCKTIGEKEKLESLYGVVPRNELDCFRKFVLACQYRCSRVITINDINIAHSLLHQFCKTFETLYGEQKVTPNIHLHMHLKDCVLDFGPIYSFWLFSFERYNGNLGSLPNNRRNIESQIMKRFLRDTHILNVVIPDSHQDTFVPVLKDLSDGRKQRGTLKESIVELCSIVRLSSKYVDPRNEKFSVYTKPLSAVKVNSLTLQEHNYLSEMYKYLYPNFAWNLIEVPFCIQKTSEVSVVGEIMGSLDSRNERSAYITAYWADEHGRLFNFNGTEYCQRPGVVEYYFKHSLMHKGKHLDLWIAKCKWFSSLPNELKHKFGKPVEVWSSLFDQNGPAIYIPNSRIHAKIVLAEITICSRKVNVVIPRLRYSNISA